MPEFLSDDWIARFAERINSSERYRAAGAKWSGGVGLLVRDLEGRHGVALDLAGGECHGARPLADAPPELRLVLEGDLVTWQQLLGGELEPIPAVLRGRLKLARGSLAELLPHAEGAKQLLLAARRVDTTFLGDSAAVVVEKPTPAASAVPATERRPNAPPPPPPLSPSPSPSPSPRRDTRTDFRVTSAAGLDFDSPPMRLFEKAKRDGIWNPADIDFSRDREDWLRLDDGERDLLLRLAALFGAGEESVVVDLLPLIQVIAAEGRLEEEIYLTSFLWEEAKHVEAFRRFFDQVAAERGDLSRYHSPSYRRVFCSELRAAMGRLRTDASVEAQADESRHLAYGVFLLSRLVAEHGEPAWRAVEQQMNRLLDPALGVIREAFAAYDPANVPFGLELEPFLAFARDQFERRLGHVERARGRSLDEVLGGDSAGGVAGTG